MSAPLTSTETLFIDEFSNNGPIDASRWSFNVWKPDGSSYYGRTQQRQELPVAENGYLRLKLDTFNPSGNPSTPTFFGSEAISLQKFDLSRGGIAIEFVARFAQEQPGIVGGLFTFGGGGDHHDEIDFEGMSNHLGQIQTNVYKNEPPGAGRAEQHQMSSPITDFHTYRVEWLPTKVRWFVNDELVRENTSHVPTMPQALHLNIWAPGQEWGHAYSDSLKAASSAAQNREYFFEVDSIKVDQISTFSGNASGNVLRGSENSDFIHGGAGNDVMLMQAGNDEIDGEDGIDVAYFAMNRSDVAITSSDSNRIVAISDAIGSNTLSNVELLLFNDQVLLTKLPRDVSPSLFDEEAYLSAYSDVAAAVQSGSIESGEVHYNTWGASEGRNPNALFHETWYLGKNPDVAQAVQNGQMVSGFQHFMDYGWAEDRDPSLYMDMSAYAEAYPDLALARRDWFHEHAFGETENVRSFDQGNRLAHYILFGAREGRIITATEEAFFMG